jgi:tryptophan-rich hypothetical protein
MEPESLQELACKRCCTLSHPPKNSQSPSPPPEPKKLLLSKWTAVTPVKKQKHFLVCRVIQPELPTAPIELVEIESVFSKTIQTIAWRDLQNVCVWLQGWV